MTEDEVKITHAGFVGLVGAPNAGKSTLFNALVGTRLAIVSEKPQATRRRVHGVVEAHSHQTIFVDTPGVISGKTPLHQFLADELADVVLKCDVVLILLHAQSSPIHVGKMSELVLKIKKPWALVITQAGSDADLSLPVSAFYTDAKVPKCLVKAQELPEKARKEVLELVAPLLPPSPGRLVEGDDLSLEPGRFFAAEFVREACFRNTQKEVPYGLAVRVDKYDESGKMPHISCQIVVDREGHKGILLGAKGATIKKIGMEARQAVENLVGGQVFLELHVKVKEGWSRNPRMMKELGYHVRKE